MATIVVSDIIDAIGQLCTQFAEATAKRDRLNEQWRAACQQRDALAVEIERQRRRLDDALGLVHVGLAIGPD